MRILFIYSYFGTPSGSWSTRVYEFTRRWVADGHIVEVITAPYEKSDIKSDGFISKTQIEGINVIVVNSADNNRLSLFKRGCRALVFSTVSCFFALTKRYDVLISSSGPITVGFPLVIAKIIRSKKTIFEVRDLWPAGGIELGLIKNPIIKKLSWTFEATCYKYSDLVVTASPGQLMNIKERFPAQKIDCISQVSDNELFGKEATSAIPEHLKNKIILSHIGSLGLIHNVSFWMKVALRLQEMGRDDILFLFIGDGADRESLERFAVENHLSNVMFTGLLSKIELPLWVQNSYATLFSTTDNPVQDTCAPNKVFDSFAAGTPIIQTSKGWIMRLVNEQNCGLNVDSSDYISTAISISEYTLDKNKRRVQGANALKLASIDFNPDVLAKKYLELIQGL